MPLPAYFLAQQPGQPSSSPWRDAKSGTDNKRGASRKTGDGCSASSGLSAERMSSGPTLLSRLKGLFVALSRYTRMPVCDAAFQKLHEPPRLLRECPVLT
eukprot:1275894-Rhodomonas_salina.6